MKPLVPASYAQFGVGTGGSAIVSRMLGQRDLDRACRTFTSLVAFTVILAVGFGIPMFLLMPKIVVLLGAEGEELIYNAVLYGRVYAAGMPAFMLQMAFQPFFMAAEKPELGTKLSIACGLINMALDALFIVVFDMGLFGAALASIMACCVGGFYPMWYFWKCRKEGQLRLTEIKFERRTLIYTCTNGSSEYIGNIAFSLVSMCYNLQLMRSARDARATISASYPTKRRAAGLAVSSAVTVSPIPRSRRRRKLLCSRL